MGLKRYKKYLNIILLTMLAAVINIMTATASEEPQIEQVLVNMPDIGISYRGAEGTPEAYLGGTELTLQGEPRNFQDTGTPVIYYTLLDISGSLSQSRFENIKQSLRDFIDGLRPQDGMVLITFGDEVTKIFDEKTGRDEAKEAISPLTNNDMTTALFDAMESAAKEISDKGDDGNKRVIVCISDGEDFADNTKSASSIGNDISSKGIPVYTIAVEKKSETDAEGRTNRSSFSAIAETTGGLAWTVDKLPEGVYDKTENSVLNGLTAANEGVLGTKQLSFAAPTNRSSMKNEDLVLIFPDGSRITKSVLVARHQEDQTAPEVTSFSMISLNELQVAYSEKVTGAGNSENYRLKQNGKTIGITQVTADAALPDTYNLVLAKDLENGKCELVINNVKDDSQEENPLKESGETLSIEIEGAPGETEDPDHEPPVITSLEQSGDDTLKIKFSEPVKHADSNANYSVTLNGKDWAVIQAKQTDKEKKEFQLTLAKTLVDGTLDVTVSNVTDLSQNENLIREEDAVISVETKSPIGKDDTPPKITQINTVEPDGLELVFSEKVRNADRNGSYTLTKDGKEIAVVQARTVDKDKAVYRLLLEEDLENGKYTLATNGITDISIEENPLENPSFSFELSGIKKKIDVLALILKWWPVLLTLLVILLIILMVRGRKRDSEKTPETEDSLKQQDPGDPVRQGNVNAGSGGIVIIPQNNGVPLTFYVSYGDQPAAQFEHSIDGSLFVGRSAEKCGISCKDPAMSSQHFCLVMEDNQMFVIDLDSTNGTYVNGFAISEKTLLSPGDEIRAGNMVFRFMW